MKLAATKATDLGPESFVGGLLLVQVVFCESDTLHHGVIGNFIVEDANGAFGDTSATTIKRAHVARRRLSCLDRTG